MIYTDYDQGIKKFKFKFLGYVSCFYDTYRDAEEAQERYVESKSVRTGITPTRLQKEYNPLSLPYYKDQWVVK